MKKEMLINVLQPEECRIAVLENNRLEELYICLLYTSPSPRDRG